MNKISTHLQKRHWKECVLNMEENEMSLGIYIAKKNEMIILNGMRVSIPYHEAMKILDEKKCTN